MALWKKILLGLFVAAALAAGACAVTGFNPAKILACDPMSGPDC